MDYSQSQSVFMPGLTRRGPVYNAMGALPVLSPTLKYGLMAALFAAGYYKKIPMLYAGIGAVAIWKLFPDVTAPVAAPTPPDLTPPTFDQSTVIPPDLNIPIQQ